MIHFERNPEHAANPQPDICFGCMLATIDINYQSLSTRDHVRGNASRTRRIIRSRQEKHDGLTDLKVGRRRDRADEDAIVGAPNIDGIRPRSAV